MVSRAALNLLDAFGRDADRWSSLDARLIGRDRLEESYRATGEGIRFDAALAELIAAGVLTGPRNYRYCPKCGGRWDEGAAAAPTDVGQAACTHEIEQRSDYGIDLTALQTFISDEVANRWAATKIQWRIDSGATRLTGEVSAGAAGDAQAF